MSKSILVIAAHSDDEALGCAGTLVKHIASDDAVHVLFMTDGMSSRNGAKYKVDERQKSAQKATKIMRLTSIQNFNFPDNKMDSVSLLEVTQAIEKKILEIQPEIIYTHHIGDLNIDHQITHKAVMTACRPQPGFCVKEIYAFEVLSSTEWQTPGMLPFIPNTFVDITDHIQIKRKVLEAYGEELRQPPHTRNIENTINQASVRGNSIGVEYAEAFVLLRGIK